jgi:hypothetical protein
VYFSYSSINFFSHLAFFNRQCRLIVRRHGLVVCFASLLSGNHNRFVNLVEKLLQVQQFVNGNYYIDLKEIWNHSNAFTIYYFVQNKL